METIIHECEANWGRRAYIKLVDDKVIYDDSQDEYGPIEFDIKLLTDALSKHNYTIPQDEYNRRRDKMAEQYQQIEAAITNWYNVNLTMNGIGNKTAGELTIQIMNIINQTK